MNVLVIGLGSMGRRRIRLIQQYCGKYLIAGVDFNKERCLQAEREYGIKTYSSIEEAIKERKFFCAFISTSPLSHRAVISECLTQDMHIFTELNLVNDGYKDNIELAAKMGCTLFLSSTFLYRKEVEYIKEQVQKTEIPLSYRYHVGQYLPDWHPWESYKDFFVAEKKTNGCRELLAIELPWLIETFGECEEIHSVKMSMTNLKIDYPDTYCILLKHKNGCVGLLQIDVAARKAVRSFECSNEELYLKWNGTPDSLYQYDVDNKNEKKISLYYEVDKLDNYSANIIENAYYEEIAEFFEVIAEKNLPVILLKRIGRY